MDSTDDEIYKFLITKFTTSGALSRHTHAATVQLEALIPSLKMIKYATDTQQDEIVFSANISRVTYNQMAGLLEDMGIRMIILCYGENRYYNDSEVRLYNSGDFHLVPDLKVIERNGGNNLVDLIADLKSLAPKYDDIKKDLLCDIFEHRGNLIVIPGSARRLRIYKNIFDNVPRWQITTQTFDKNVLYFITKSSSGNRATSILICILFISFMAVLWIVKNLLRK